MARGRSSKCSCKLLCSWRCRSLRMVAAFACAPRRFACLLASELIEHSEINCSRSCFWQWGHSGAGDECRTRYSNWCPQCRHLYSKTGMNEVYKRCGNGANTAYLGAYGSRIRKVTPSIVFTQPAHSRRTPSRTPKTRRHPSQASSATELTPAMRNTEPSRTFRLAAGRP